VTGVNPRGHLRGGRVPSRTAPGGERGGPPSCIISIGGRRGAVAGDRQDLAPLVVIIRGGAKRGVGGVCPGGAGRETACLMIRRPRIIGVFRGVGAAIGQLPTCPVVGEISSLVQ